MDNKNKEIEISKVFQVIKKRAWMIVIITIICSFAGHFYSEQIKPTPIYEASSRMIIHDNSSLINTLVVFFKEPPVLDQVIEELHLTTTSERLSNQINVQNVGDSQIIKVSVTNTNYEMAVKIVNTLSEVYRNVVHEILEFDGVEILTEANSMNNPIPINSTSNRLLQISFIIGIVSGIGFVFLLDSLDNTIRNEQDIETLLELPVIGSVSKISNQSLKKQNERKMEVIKGDLFDEQKEKRTSFK